MDLVSFAQNLEDVLIWRALGHIEKGRYIDVGAQHPTVDSVSKMFHEQGWHGTHVEPSSTYAMLLRRERPGDEIIEAVISSQVGVIDFHEFYETGLSTVELSVANMNADRGYRFHTTVKTCLTLDDIFDRNSDVVHWLKIDVEGHERSVLEGWTSATRPWLLIIESTFPGTGIQSHEDWETLLIAKGYSYVWFDGLNRYYVSNDHGDLADALQMQPHIFDQFMLSGTSTASFAVLLNERIEAAEARCTAAESELLIQSRDYQAAIEALSAENEALHAQHVHDSALVAHQSNAHLQDAIRNLIEVQCEWIEQLRWEFAEARVHYEQRLAAESRHADGMIAAAAALFDVERAAELARREAEQANAASEIARLAANITDRDSLLVKVGDERANDAATAALKMDALTLKIAEGDALLKDMAEKHAVETTTLRSRIAELDADLTRCEALVRQTIDEQAVKTTELALRVAELSRMLADREASLAELAKEKDANASVSASTIAALSLERDALTVRLLTEEREQAARTAEAARWRTAYEQSELGATTQRRSVEGVEKLLSITVNQLVSISTIGGEKLESELSFADCIDRLVIFCQSFQAMQLRFDALKNDKIWIRTLGYILRWHNLYPEKILLKL